MIEVPIYVVDAFTGRHFRGNPAAVCPLTRWLPDELMQHIAAENNLSATAFFVTGASPCALRWFSPRAEVSFCGHGTLASGHVVFSHLEPSRRRISFGTKVGELQVGREGDAIALRVPAFAAEPCRTPPAVLRELLRDADGEIFESRQNYFAVLGSQRAVAELDPDFAALATLHPYGVCVTAPGTEVDFVSRHFVPSFGVPEDAVTGSTHATLVPYWAARLGRSELRARQLSARGGELACRVEDGAVVLVGCAVTYLEGRIRVPG